MLEYINMNQNLHQSMLHVQFTNIQSEQSSVTFAVNGLGGHIGYRGEARAIRLNGMLDTIQGLEVRILEEELARTTTKTTVTMGTQPILQSDGKPFRNKSREGEAPVEEAEVSVRVIETISKMR